MQLVRCSRPAGPLEPAPSTSLREAGTDGQWLGFWSLDDERYYARCDRSDGREEWFRIADVGVPRRWRTRDAAVLAFPVAPASVPRMIVGRYRGQAMLVGRRAARPARDAR